MKDSPALPGFTGNQLKILALVSMTLDHIGVILLPRLEILRILGRLAFPIFAYLIAEGCRHTRNRKQYLLTMAGFAALCQIVCFFAIGSVYMSVLVTFSLSISLIFALDDWKNNQRSPLAALGLFCAILFLTRVLPHLVRGTDYGIDYGLWGTLLPVLVYLVPDKPGKIAMAALAMGFIAVDSASIQWWSFAALPLLYAYSGKRGKRKLKYLFYVYYPAHLVVLQGLSMLLS